MDAKTTGSPQIDPLYTPSEEKHSTDQAIEQGNEAVLLRVDAEKGVPLKLARDGHVSSQ